MMVPARPSPAVERICRALFVIGWGWFVFTAFWGIADMPTAGHLGAGSAVTSMMAEGEIRFHSFYPMWDWYSVVDPMPNAAYTHHPFGPHWMSVLFVALIGHRDIVCNLPAAIMSSLMPPMLFRIGTRAWGIVAGTATALGLVVLPITVGFSIFHNVEIITIFGAILFFWGHLEYQALGRTRHLLASLAGALVCTSGDWPGYLIVGVMLAWGFFRAYASPSWMTPAVKPSRYHMWWAWSAAIAVGTFMVWMAFYQHLDRIGEWLAQGKSRGGGSDVPLKTVLEARKNWIDFSFTPLAIWIGKAAVPIAVLRLVVRRLDEEALSIAALFGAVVQYVVFRRGADIHIFWPHYFGLYYALAVGQIVVTAQWLGGAIAKWFSPPNARAVAAASAFVAMGPSVFLIVPDGARALGIWRRTGGKYDDKGSLWDSDADYLFVVSKLARPRVHFGEALGHQGAWGWEQDWALGNRSEDAQDPSPRRPVWVARVRELGADHLKRLAPKYHLRIYGEDGVVVVLRGEPAAPLDAYSLDLHEPNFFQWLFTNNVEPVRTLPDAPDPFTTWEWRVHLDVPAAAPTAQPKTFEELRIAHNVAVEQGRDDEAERLRERIVDQLDRRPETHFSDGSELVGVRVTRGVKPMLEVFVQAAGPTKGDSTFTIRSAVVAKNPLSLVPIDTTECDRAQPPPLPTKLWRKGYIYRFHAALNHRIGRERYWGTWSGGPRTKSGNPKIDLVEMP